MSRGIQKVLEQIERVTNFDAHLYRKSTLKRRLASRMSATRSKTYQDYLAYLKEDRSEYEKFLDALTIHMTDFFRDQNVFDTLKKEILPDIFQSVKDKKRGRVRIWSIGCSRGQEPYSLAMLLKEILNSRMNDSGIIIHATDMNRSALKKAEAALYTEAEVKNVPQRYLKKYFEREGTDCRVKKDVRDLVRFKRQDLIKGNSLGKFHLILCRNLFIFFEPELQERMFKKIYDSLKKDGILVLGKAESPKDDELFQPIIPHNNIYRKVA